jgi:hypothetical protein
VEKRGDASFRRAKSSVPNFVFEAPVPFQIYELKFPGFLESK